MPSVAVRRLHLKTPPGRGAAGRQHLEDALRLSAPDEPRLLVVRRLDLGRLPVHSRADAWSRRTADRLGEQRARAVHAMHPGADGADAVWFRSIEEARTQLLLLLASGRSARAWFWRLVMPKDFDRPVGECLARWISEAEQDEPATIALARAVVAAAEAGLLPAIVGALPAVQRLSVLSAGEGETAGQGTPVPPGAVPPDLDRQAASLFARLAAGVGPAVGSVLAELPRGAPAAMWIACMVLLAAAPELVRHRARCAALASAVLTAPHPFRPASARPRGRDAMIASGAVAPLVVPEPPPRAASRAPGIALPEKDISAGQVRAPIVSAIPPPERDVERASQAAGVLLAIRALDRLGLGARLATDSDAALAGFGRGLLTHVASHARTPPDDPLFAILEPPAAEPFADALHAWRRGLDGWLRRRARMRLAELAGRGGWLLRVDSELHVRLPVNAADLRLRRLALDVDPGWVGWLGFVVRYHFSDVPLG
jgi:hypothetical protein